MGRILALDYGTRRTGIAATDPLRIIATALDTVETKDIWVFFEKYLQSEPVDVLVVGHAPHSDGTETPLESDIQLFLTAFSAKYPAITIHRHDEHRTSQRAAQVIFMSGVKQKKRRDKSLLDKVSAAIILQEYMGFI